VAQAEVVCGPVGVFHVPGAEHEQVDPGRAQVIDTLGSGALVEPWKQLGSLDSSHGGGSLSQSVDAPPVRVVERSE